MVIGVPTRSRGFHSGPEDPNKSRGSKIYTKSKLSNCAGDKLRGEILEIMPSQPFKFRCLSLILLLIQTLTGLNDILNAVMSIQLPFAILPALCFSSSRVIMGEFRSGQIFGLVKLRKC